VPCDGAEIVTLKASRVVPLCRPTAVTHLPLVTADSLAVAVDVYVVDDVVVTVTLRLAPPKPDAVTVKPEPVVADTVPIVPATPRPERLPNGAPDGRALGVPEGTPDGGVAFGAPCPPEPRPPKPRPPKPRRVWHPELLVTVTVFAVTKPDFELPEPSTVTQSPLATVDFVAELTVV
jgi:hypothetical protein